MHRLGTPPAPSRTGWPVAPPHWPPRTANPRPGRCTRTVPQASGTRAVWGRHVGSVAAHRYRSSGAQVRGPRAAGSSVRSVYTVLRLALDGVVRDGLVAKKCGGCREAAGCGAQGGQTHRQRGRDRAAERCRRVGCREMLVPSPPPRCRGEALGLRWTDIDLDAGLVDRARHPRAHRRQARGVRTQDRRSRRSALRWWRCCGRAASSKPPNGCTRVISGPTADSYSPRSSGHRSNRATW